MHRRKRTLDAAVVAAAGTHTLYRLTDSGGGGGGKARPTLCGDWRRTRTAAAARRRREERETPRVYFLSAFLTEQFVGKTIH